MDVKELLSYQPDKPQFNQSTGKRKNENNVESLQEIQNKKYKAVNEQQRDTINEDEKNRILKMMEDEDTELDEQLTEASLKRLILQFEKKVFKNQEMRIKYPDMPEKFMESELELNDSIQELHIVSTAPELYHILIELNCIKTMLQLLSHENTDVAIAVVDLLQELTDVENSSDMDAGNLVDTLIENQIVALLLQNIDRLDENIKEESQAIHNSLGIIENMTDIHSELSISIAQQGLLQWLLRRLRAKVPFDDNKVYCSEIMAILLQTAEENRKLIGEMDGIDVLLQQLAMYKRHNAASNEEREMVENLFDCLCSCLLYLPNKARFLKGEGLQLMNLMIREKKMSRSSAIKVLNHAMSGIDGFDNCQKFIDILGLRTVFPVFMKTPKLDKKKDSMLPTELEEHVICIIASLLKNCQGLQLQRLLNKFSENNHEKVDRLLELHFKYLQKVQQIDEIIEKEKHNIKVYGGEIDDEEEENFYLQRLEGGLYLLQLVDLIMIDISARGTSSIKQRVMETLGLRGGSVKTIRGIIREYAGHIGETLEEDKRREEQAKILELLEKF